MYEGEWINNKKLHNGNIETIIKDFKELVESDLQHIDILILKFESLYNEIKTIEPINAIASLSSL